MDLGIEGSELRGATEMTRAKKGRGKRKRSPLFSLKSTIGLLIMFCAGYLVFAPQGIDAELPLLHKGPLSGETILIDPGHGGFDPGACGSIYFEKDIVLNVGLLLGEKLEKAGAKVVYTRTSDDIGEDLQGNTSAYRLGLVEKYQPTIIISVHCNDFEDPKIRGAQVFYNGSGNVRSEELAQFIQDELELHTGTTREISQEIGHFMLDETLVPAVTVETGFLSNPEEEILLGSPSYQEKLAQCIYNAIVSFVNAGQ